MTCTTVSGDECPKVSGSLCQPAMLLCAATCARVDAATPPALAQQIKAAQEKLKISSKEFLKSPALTIDIAGNVLTVLRVALIPAEACKQQPRPKNAVLTPQHH